MEYNLLSEHWFQVDVLPQREVHEKWIGVHLGGIPDRGTSLKEVPVPLSMMHRINDTFGDGILLLCDTHKTTGTGKQCIHTFRSVNVFCDDASYVSGLVEFVFSQGRQIIIRAFCFAKPSHRLHIHISEGRQIQT